MRLHSLKGMHEYSPSSKIDLPGFRDDAALNPTARPECVSHGPPRLARICPKKALPIFPHEKPGRYPRHSQVNYALLVDHGFHGVRIAGRAKSDGTAVCVEGEFLGVEICLVEGI